MEAHRWQRALLTACHRWMQGEEDFRTPKDLDVFLNFCKDAFVRVLCYLIYGLWPFGKKCVFLQHVKNLITFIFDQCCFVPGARLATAYKLFDHCCFVYIVQDWTPLTNYVATAISFT
jgi:hypothetical protein